MGKVIVKDTSRNGIEMGSEVKFAKKISIIKSRNNLKLNLILLVVLLNLGLSIYGIFYGN